MFPVVPVGPVVPVVLGTLVLTSSQGLGNMTSRTLVMKLHTEMTVLVSEEVIGEDEDRRGICGQKGSLEQAAGWGRTDCALPGWRGTCSSGRSTVAISAPFFQPAWLMHTFLFPYIDKPSPVTHVC